MNFLWSLFNLRNKHRQYAFLDKSGICRAIRHTAVTPAGAGWVEISESCPSWLNHPLPDIARIAKPAAAYSHRAALNN